jgi:hypothetical protein
VPKSFAVSCLFLLTCLSDNDIGGVISGNDTETGRNELIALTAH